jgi:hypothetical protein
VEEDTSQGPKISQMSLEGSKGNSISGNLDPTAKALGDNGTLSGPPRVKEISQLHPADTGQDMETKKAVVASSFIPEHSISNQVDPSLSSYDNGDSEIGILQQLLPKFTPSHQHREVSTHPSAKRSASQATTVSATSTEPAHAAADEDDTEEKQLFNPMSMMNETMVLERDISDIISARLQEGNPDLLEALQGEILIKMAVRDDEVFEAVSKILKS